MKHLLLPILIATLPLAGGCAIGLPHGPLEPSISADCVDYLNENWIPPADETSVEGPYECGDAGEPVVRAPVCCESPERQGGCVRCPLLPPSPAALPPYVDPGPPGRFLPVPVRPVFSPQPTNYYSAPMHHPM